MTRRRNTSTVVRALAAKGRVLAAIPAGIPDAIARMA